MSIRQAMILTTIAVAATAIVAAERADPRPLLLLNPSDSAPHGLYVLTPAATIARGDLVAAEVPQDAAALAAERGYLPMGWPVIKTVWAAAGDHVCADNERVSASNRPDLVALPRDRSGRALPLWSGCRTLSPGEVFLASDAIPHSFDSRYFGPVRTDSVLGLAVLVWPRRGRTEP